MLTWLNVIKVLIFVLIALLIGLFGLSLFFSDLGPGETWTSRLVVAALLFSLSGLFIGYFNPRFWMIAGLVAWGPVFLGIVGLIPVEPVERSLLGWVEVLAMLLLPLGIALGGGYAGALLGRKRLIRRLSNRILQHR